MKLLNSAARKGALLAFTGISALALSACGAGQVSQTADQVAAVDGASVNSASGDIALRDVQVVVNDNGSAGVKFTAVNQSLHEGEITMNSVSVDGESVSLSKNSSIAKNCSLVADVKASDITPKAKDQCISYITTSVDNPGFAVGGTATVDFTFGQESVTAKAPIVANQNESAGQERVK